MFVLCSAGISLRLVKYFDTLRLTVVSPMKAVDQSLTKRLSHHLNRLAEGVGVEKGRIPYSRKSSPASSTCTSPSTLLLHESNLVIQ